jgi:hypothetical protein
MSRSFKFRPLHCPTKNRQGSNRDMRTIINDILEMLNEDMVDHGLLAQCVKQAGSDASQLQERIENVIEELLASGKVEIGVAKVARPDYVEFIAWKGTILGRVRRAMDAVAAQSGADKEFAYWLALRENIDRFENE